MRKIARFQPNFGPCSQFRFNARFGRAAGHRTSRPWQERASPQKEGEPQIHVLGLGNLGRLYAHALATLPDPPSIVLLVHRPSLFEEYRKASRKITIKGPSGKDSYSSNYDLKAVDDSTSPIEALIVATKAVDTVQAISSIKDRLGPQSTILFTQNGMDIIADVTQALFQKYETRPKYLAAVTSHGIYSRGPFKSVHAGQADIAIGPACLEARNHRDGIADGCRYLVDKLVAAPSLAAREVTMSELNILRLQKLVVNAMINPLTVIFNCNNGELFTRKLVLDFMRDLLKEASQVLRYLVQYTIEFEVPFQLSTFSDKTLEKVVLEVAKKTAENTSSMLQDIRAGRPTEIDYMNGYIVSIGRGFGIDVSLNEKLVQMVKERKLIGVDKIQELYRAV